MSSSSSSSNSNFLLNKQKVSTILFRGLQEEKDLGPMYFPKEAAEEQIYNYIIEYVALNVCRELNSETLPSGEPAHKYLQIPDDAYIAARQIHILQILKGYEDALKGASNNLRPYVHYIEDFKNGLISIPDHKELHSMIKELLTLTTHNTARYLTLEAQGKKRKGGRRKTQYRLRKSSKGKTRGRGKKRSTK